MSGDSSSSYTGIKFGKDKKEILKMEVDSLRSEYDVLKKQADIFSRLAALAPETISRIMSQLNMQDTEATHATESGSRLSALEEELNKRQMEFAINGGAATPEQRALIAEVANRAIESGTSDIKKFTGDSLSQLRQELSPSLGFRSSDSPIIDRGGRILDESIRQQANLVSDVRGAQAKAELDYPVAIHNAGTEAQRTNLAAKNFQAQLRQLAYQNRLSLTGQTSQIGLGMKYQTKGLGVSQDIRTNPGQISTFNSILEGGRNFTGGFSDIGQGIGGIMG